MVPSARHENKVSRFLGVLDVVTLRVLMIHVPLD
eukprot:CAMPEP_0116920104 /NCGR_PEP_ID=MMETSP0467-20121206/20805_1 /TAXON_ID=283647 /ORGANISM="Mesodinium pulex, Strain SPMC105" /LENGTH=33 /DNA_ID= /DNA_START= /DNA_END= /DNA_ORIENTATION=